MRVFLQNHFLEFWGLSNPGNAYAPLREEISRRLGEINALPASDQADAKRILYFGLAAADAVMTQGGGDIPDFLYTWINPDPKN